MNDEEKEAIEFTKYYMKTYFYEDISIQDDFDFEDSIKTILNLIEKQQKEIEEINKEVRKTLAFEKFLITKERNPDKFNEGRFYLAQIIYEILKGNENTNGTHKENKDIKYIEFIPKSVIREKIKILEELKKELAKQLQEALNIKILAYKELLEEK